MNDILVFRITENTVCVDGVVFIKSGLGIYRPEREEFEFSNIHRNYLESFLKAEKIEEEGILKLNFDSYLLETLSSLKIKASLN